MDSISIISTITIIILVLFSAYFSAAETAFSSLNKRRIKSLSDGGSRRAGIVLKLSENYDKLLSTILVGNNIVNIASATVTTTLFIRYFPHIGATLSTIVITVVVLIFGEISPKSLAKESPETFAMFSAPFLQLLVFILTPVNFVFSQWKKLLSLIFKSSNDMSITEEELLTIVDEAQHEGAIEEEDKKLINNVIDFNDLKVSEIFIPRVDIVAFPADTTYEEITALFINTGYSRLPVYEESIDSIIGVVHIHDFFALVMSGKKNLKDIIQAAVYVAPSMKISDLLKTLQKTKSHMAVITDEYGGTMGIVTMEDILEELVGEIWDEHDKIVEQFTKLDENTYKIMCNANLDDMFKLFNITKESDSSTVSGWIMEELDKVPEENDSFEYQNLAVTVVKTNHHRAVECIVKRKPS